MRLLALLVAALLLAPVATAQMANKGGDCEERAVYWMNKAENSAPAEVKQAYATMASAYLDMEDAGIDCTGILSEGGGGHLDGSDESDPLETPGFGLVALVAALGAALILVRRRS